MHFQEFFDLGQVVINVFVHKFHGLFSVQHPGYWMLKNKPPRMVFTYAFQKFLQITS